MLRAECSLERAIATGFDERVGQREIANTIFDRGIVAVRWVKLTD
jgi:hypothetical protein